MGANSNAKMLQRYVAMAKLLNVYLNHFPRHEKYALAGEIRSELYKVFTLTVEAQKRYRKKTTLANLDIAHEKLRMLCWLANELGYFEYHNGRRADHNDQSVPRRYLAINRHIDEIGRMIGGWIAKEVRIDKGSALT